MILPPALEVSILLLVLVLLAYGLFLSPPRHPANIPAVPFWVTLLPFVKDVDQEETYRIYLADPLRTHGAVKIFFGARWNILVARPELVAQVFRDEDLFRKSGNNEKIPHSVLADFLGENVISAHGEPWRLFRGVVRPGLVGGFDIDILARNTEILAGLIREQIKRLSGGAIAVQDLLQRYTIANTAQGLFHTDFRV